MRPFVVGVTGGIGSGKTTVCDAFLALGAEVLDADVMARTVVAPGRPAFAEIVARFGIGVVAPDGTLRRDELRRRVFADDRARRALEAIVHPRVRAAVFAGVQASTAAYVLACIPLLVETRAYDGLIDRVLVVECATETRLTRAMARDGLTRNDVEAIIRSQATPAARRLKADDVIDNNATRETTTDQVRKLHARYITIAEHRHA